MIVPKERSAQPPTPVALTKVILAEGDTPTHLLEALARHLGIDKTIEIRNYGGITQLKTFLKTLASTSEFKDKVRSLGIVRDAENNAVGARTAAESAVTAAGVPSQVVVSYFILPDNAAPGMIETLLQSSVANLPIFQAVTQFFVSAGAHGFTLPAGPIQAKNYTQVYLATQAEVQMMPGIAAYKGAWPFNHVAYSALKAFLQAL
jgi:hypothetical protein